MAEPEAELAITDHAAVDRYEAHLGDELVGILEYGVRGQKVALLHTEVPPAWEGRGIASRLARFALADARARGLRIVPLCPYVQTYLKRHPEERDVVEPRPA